MKTKFLKKVAARSNSSDFFIRSLYQTVGNKVYMRDIEALFSRIDLEANEADALDRLGRDLKGLKN